MSEAGDAAFVERQGDPALVIRLLGWSILGALAAFLFNNILIVGFGFAGPREILAGKISAIVPVLVYVIAIGLGATYVMRTSDTSLRWDARRIYTANLYVLRGCYFAVLFIGLADVSIAFMRAEGIFSLFLNLDTARLFQRSDFVGTYIYFPLLILSFIVAAFTRTLGFMWLSLLIIIAELSIVITRFVFSYEQAFMDDLVRYWYSALFLLAAAYTLHEEGHVRVDIFYTKFDLRKKGLFNAVGALILGIPTCAIILAVGLDGKESIINGPALHFEVTQTGSLGMYVKYQMAIFLGLFAATMLVQLVSFFFEAVADFRGEAGHRNTDNVEQ